MEAQAYHSAVPSSPTLFDKPKHHDPTRYEERPPRPVDDERQDMAYELRGKILWLEAHDFQEKLLPKPPPAVMPSESKLRTISKAFEEMMETYAQEAADQGKKSEDVLSEKFVCPSYIFRIFC